MRRERDERDQIMYKHKFISKLQTDRRRERNENNEKRYLHKHDYGYREGDKDGNIIINIIYLCL